MQELDGKVAVITGGASGIGLAVAHACADAGMKLVLADIEAERLAQVADEFRATNTPILPIVCDVSQRPDIEMLAQQTYDHFGAVHFLFNNAGVAGPVGNIWQATEDDWQWTLGVNVWSIIYATQIFVPLMLQQEEESHIVNTASIAGMIAGPSMGAYRLSKHAVVSFSETLHLELEQMESKIGVSVLCPAWTKTRINASDRNRPAPASEIEVTPLVAAQMQHAVDEVKIGMPAAQVASAVLDAIREKRFYILTHPNFTGAIAIRMKDILAGKNPRNLMTRILNQQVATSN